MRVEHLKIENCGLHAALELNCDAPLVGIVGPNGKGKSTVLEMLKFLLTGETKDNIDTYVHWGAGNGKASMRFRKQGQVYNLEKKFGKSPSRSLSWDPTKPKLTKVKDIDEFLGTLMGVDRRAMMNAVFIEQGMLKNMLFQGDTDRRSMFIRLVNLGWCGGRSDIVAGVIPEISRQISNLEPLLASAESLLADKQQAQALALMEMDKVQDCTAQIAELSARIQLSASRDELFRNIGQTDQQIEIRKSQLETTNPGATEARLAGDKVLLASEVSARQALSARLSRNTLLAEQKRSYARLGEEKKQVDEDLSIVTKELAESGCSLDELKASSSELELSMRQVSTRIRLVRDLSDTEKKLAARKTELSSAEGSYKISQSVLPEKKRKMESVRALRDTKNQQLKLMCSIVERFPGLTSAERATCPKCELTVCDLKVPSRDEIDAVTNELSELTRELGTVVDAHDDANYDVNRTRALVSRLGDAVRELQGELSDINKELLGLPNPAGDSDLQKFVEEMDAKLKECSTKLVRYSGKAATKAHLEGRQRKLMLDMLSLKDWRTVASQELENEWLRSMSDKLGQMDEKIKAEQDRLNQLNAKFEVLKELDTQKSRMQAELKDLDAALATELSPENMGLLAELGSIQAVLTLHRSRQENWQKAFNALEQAKAGLAAAKAQVDDIKARMAQDASKRELVKDLRKVQELLSDGGLPSMVVRHYFTTLTSLTQKCLIELGANFRVEPDPDRELAFKFERTDGIPGLLGMNKLSGGQRVRLCVAFLMAVQRLLVPDVGLMVLDEISDGLDQEGVESLADLLRSAGTRLKNSDHQIWVVDHRPEIAAALPLCVTL